MTSRIAVTGSLAYDFLSQYDQPFDRVLLKDQLHQLSVCFVVPNKERHFGGTAGNIAYNLALLKAPPTLFAGVGYDFKDYAKRLKKLKVDLSPLRPTSYLPTPSATIITDPNGNQITEFCIGAMGAGLKPHAQAIEKASAVIIAPDDPGWMMDYIQLAKQFRIPYFFDPGQGLPRFSKDDLVRALRGAEGVFVNDYEFELLKNMTNLSLDQIRALTTYLIVTHGEKGSTIYSEEGIFSIPVVPPKEVVNPTGCGDAYRAGFLKGYVDHRPIEVCGKMGAVMAAYVVEQVGTQMHQFSERAFKKRYKSAFKEAL